MVREIIDLHGNKFKTLGYKVCLEIPIIGKEKLIYTRDLLSGVAFSLFYGKDRYKGYFYNQSINAFICYTLEKIGYEESKDIRKAHLYGRKRNKEISSTNGNYCSCIRVSENPKA